MIGRIYLVRAAVAMLCLGMVAACSASYRNHGYIPLETDVAELLVGVDSRASVDDTIGPPSTSGLLGGGDYYYVRSRVKELGMLRPKEVERQVLAISFDEADTIANIERFSLQDGNIVPISRRVTDSSVEGNGFLRQMLGNFGNFNAGDFLN